MLSHSWNTSCACPDEVGGEEIQIIAFRMFAEPCRFEWLMLRWEWSLGQVNAEQADAAGSREVCKVS